MEIIIRDAIGMCPDCSGLLKPLQLHISWQCVDCRHKFRALEPGYDKNGIIMKKEIDP